MRLRKLLTVAILGAFLAACGSGAPQIDGKTKLKRELDANYRAANSRVVQLSNGLQTGTVTNAVVLQSYAKAALKKKPEYEDIIKVLASEGTVDGPTYVSINNRLEEARKRIPKSLETIESAKNLNEEFESIITAARNYDAMLVDAINVLADFTGGELPKLRELQYEGEAPSTAPVGSEYIGNTNYGQWKQDSNGTSFWAFYGQYAMFSRLFSGPSYYGGWSNNRRPSYYHDYGRGSYSSPTGRANQNTALQQTKKQYTSSGRTFKSSYAKSQPTIKGAAPGTKPVFKSSYARSSTNRSPYSSSTAPKSSYNSRSSSSGRSSYSGGK